MFSLLEVNAGAGLESRLLSMEGLAEPAGCVTLNPADAFAYARNITAPTILGDAAELAPSDVPPCDLVYGLARAGKDSTVDLALRMGVSLVLRGDSLALSRWALQRGCAHILTLSDRHMGGATRTRCTFYVWTPQPIQLEERVARFRSAYPYPWYRMGLDEFEWLGLEDGDDRGDRFAPAPAVGREILGYYDEGDARRLTTLEQAALLGHADAALTGTRAQQLRQVQRTAPAACLLACVRALTEAPVVVAGQGIGRALSASTATLRVALPQTGTVVDQLLVLRDRYLTLAAFGHANPTDVVLAQIARVSASELNARVMAAQPAIVDVATSLGTPSAAPRLRSAYAALSGSTSSLPTRP